MAKGDQWKFEKGEVIFHSLNKGHMIGADDIQREQRYTNGDISKSSAIITFTNGVFRTKSKAEIKIIENTNEFKRGRIHRVTAAELGIIVAQEALSMNLPAKMVPVGESEIGYDDANQPETAPADDGLNPVVT